MLVATQHYQCLGAAVVGDQAPTPTCHVAIRDKARWHAKPIVDHLPHNPSMLLR